MVGPFNSQMAAGKKRFLSRLVRDLRLLFFFPPRWKKVEETMSGLCGVLDYVSCFSEAAGSVDGVNGWEAGLRDGAGFVHNTL